MTAVLQPGGAGTGAGRARHHPFWAVHAVLDPEGRSGDFIYTAGLAAEDVPELHMWSRPPGQDPAEWHFTLLETGLLINRLARRLVTGDLQVGDTWEEAAADGRVTVMFEVGEALPSADLMGYQAGDVPMLPITWRVTGEPQG
jgi:hypothetical protein